MHIQDLILRTMYSITENYKDDENVIPFSKTRTCVINTITMRLGTFGDILLLRLGELRHQSFGYVDYFNIVQHRDLINAFKLGNISVINMGIEQSKRNTGMLYKLTDKHKKDVYVNLLKGPSKSDDFEFVLKVAQLLDINKRTQIEEWSRNGRLDLLQQAFKKNSQLGPNSVDRYLLNDLVIKEAAANGDFLIVKWWLDHVLNKDMTLSIYWQEEVCEKSALNNHFDLLEWLLGEKFRTSCLICINLAKVGNLEFLKKCRALGCSWNNGTTRMAAGYGRLDILTYCVENGCPYDESSYKAAVEGGHLDCLKYLKLIGCNWNESVLVAAIQYEHYTILKWLLANGCLPSGRKLYRPYGILHLILRKPLKLIPVLIKLFNKYGFLQDEITFSKLVLENNVKIVQYFWMHGCSFDRDMYINAAGNTALQIFQWRINNTNYNDVLFEDTLKMYTRLNVSLNSQWVEWYETQNC